MMQKLQLTLAIIKPHAVKNPVALSFIRNVMKNKFIVVKTKRVSLDTETAGDFYKEHVGKFFYNRLVTFMASGCIDLHIMGHSNAIEVWRRLLGPTSVYKAQFQQPYCLRSLFGISDTRNVAHGSDSPISAEREIKFFFPEFSFYDWHHNNEELYRKGPVVFNDYLFQHVRRLGCIDLHIMGHSNAIEVWRRLLGPTSVYKAQFQQPYCLRSLFGISDTRNVAHGSDSPISAEREIKFFFPEFSFYEWHHNNEQLYRKGPVVFNDYLFQHVRRL